MSNDSNDEEGTGLDLNFVINSLAPQGISEKDVRCVWAPSTQEARPQKNIETCRFFLVSGLRWTGSRTKAIFTRPSMTTTTSPPTESLQGPPVAKVSVFLLNIGALPRRCRPFVSTGRIFVKHDKTNTALGGASVLFPVRIMRTGLI